LCDVFGRQVRQLFEDSARLILNRIIEWTVRHSLYAGCVCLAESHAAILQLNFVKSNELDDLGRNPRVTQGFVDREACQRSPNGGASLP
jgi:hypothetical protein